MVIILSIYASSMLAVCKSPGGTPMKERSAQAEHGLYLAMALKRKFKHVYASPDEKKSPEPANNRRRRDSFFEEVWFFVFSPISFLVFLLLISSSSSTWSCFCCSCCSCSCSSSLLFFLCSLFLFSFFSFFLLHLLLLLHYGGSYLKLNRKIPMKTLRALPACLPLATTASHTPPADLVLPSPSQLSY